MLVDAEHDQYELGDDAREDHADHHPDQAGDDPEQTREWTERHQRETGYDAGESEQSRNTDREPVEDLDDGRRNEPFPLEQVANIEHGVPPPDAGVPPVTADLVLSRPVRLRCRVVRSSPKPIRTLHCGIRMVNRTPRTPVVNAGLISARGG